MATEPSLDAPQLRFELGVDLELDVDTDIAKRVRRNPDRLHRHGADLQCDRAQPPCQARVNPSRKRQGANFHRRKPRRTTTAQLEHDAVDAADVATVLVDELRVEDISDEIHVPFAGYVMPP